MKFPRFELDETNQKFLSQLQKIYEIEFEEKNIEHCEVFTINKKSIIFYNPKIIDNDSIAHELLHIWLNIYNYCSPNILYLLSQENKKLKNIFIKYLTDYIGNCMDHLKMYPKYIEMGYDPNKFVTLGLKEKSNLDALKSIKIKNIFNFYNPKSIEIYIGNLISIYADHYCNDYQEHLHLLEKKEPALFKIITEFWKSWINFDIENIDPIYNSDIEILNTFYYNMENWSKNKMIK
jgi:hypothetical protein